MLNTVMELLGLPNIKEAIIVKEALLDIMLTLNLFTTQCQMMKPSIYRNNMSNPLVLNFFRLPACCLPDHITSAPKNFFHMTGSDAYCHLFSPLNAAVVLINLSDYVFHDTTHMVGINFIFDSKYWLYSKKKEKFHMVCQTG